MPAASNHTPGHLAQVAWLATIVAFGSVTVKVSCRIWLDLRVMVRLWLVSRLGLVRVLKSVYGSHLSHKL